MINAIGEIKATFEIGNISYEVISSEYGKSRSVWDAIDTIKNSNGQQKTMTRLEWKQYFDNKLSK